MINYNLMKQQYKKIYIHKNNSFSCLIQAKLLEKELDEYVYNPAEAKERLPQSPYRRLELIPEAARDIIKVQ